MAAACSADKTDRNFKHRETGGREMKENDGEIKKERTYCHCVNTIYMLITPLVYV